MALVVLAVGFGPAFQALSGGLGWLDRSRRDRDALGLAESLLARVGHDVPLRGGDVQGRTPEGLAWRVAVTPYEEAGLRPRGPFVGYNVAVAVGWTEGRHARRVELTSLRLGPAGARP